AAGQLAFFLRCFLKEGRFSRTSGSGATDFARGENGLVLRRVPPPGPPPAPRGGRRPCSSGGAEATAGAVRGPSVLLLCRGSSMGIFRFRKRPSPSQEASRRLCRPQLGTLEDRIVPAVNPIVLENQLPGTPQSVWAVNGAGDPSILGFATDISV